MKILNLAVVGAFAGGVAGALIGASTMFAADVLIPPKAAAQIYVVHTTELTPLPPA